MRQQVGVAQPYARFKVNYLLTAIIYWDSAFGVRELGARDELIPFNFPDATRKGILEDAGVGHPRS